MLQPYFSLLTKSLSFFVILLLLLLAKSSSWSRIFSAVLLIGMILFLGKISGGSSGGVVAGETVLSSIAFPPTEGVKKQKNVIL